MAVRRPVTVCMLLVVGLSYCFPMAPRVDSLDQDAKRVASIKPGPHMAQADAEAIAWLYFRLHFGGCGFPGDPIDQGDSWAYRARVGIAGTPYKAPILIDKSTGRVSCESKPTYESPAQLAKAFLRAS